MIISILGCPIENSQFFINFVENLGNWAVWLAPRKQPVFPAYAHIHTYMVIYSLVIDGFPLPGNQAFVSHISQPLITIIRFLCINNLSLPLLQSQHPDDNNLIYFFHLSSLTSYLLRSQLCQKEKQKTMSIKRRWSTVNRWEKIWTETCERAG